MKRAFIVVVVIAVAVVTGGYFFGTQILLSVVAAYIAPEENFSEQAPPPAPDYDHGRSWVALPDRQDPGDQLPRGITRKPTGVAVFFVHPTTFFGKHWNQPAEDTTAEWILNERVLRHQASVFNSCCDIYAPRYRQATFYSFMDREGNGERALQLAYTDVAAAFDVFLQRLTPQQPFIVAGHSQGTRHAAQLVRERISDTPLQARLVAAYLVGFSIRADQLGGLPACATATQFGCAVGWNTVETGGAGLWRGTHGLLCTNPLTWRHQGGYAAHDFNRGGIGYPDYSKAAADEDVTRMDVEVGVADAECSADGRLVVRALRSNSFPSRMSGNSLHVYDYSLFHMNIRDNAQQRIEAYLARR